MKNSFRPDLSIIIPVYNEAEGIPIVLNKLCSEEALKDAEIIVVDDGSTDKTHEQVKLFPKVHLVRHPVNRGYGAAISTGVKLSKGKFVVWFDGDGQHRVEDLIRVAQRLLQEDLDFCIGVRDSNSYQDTNRKLGKFILRQAVRLVARKSLKDFNSGLRGFKKDIIKRYLHLFPKRFGASTLTSLLMIERGYIGEEVPITVCKRIGKSSVKQISDGFGTLMLLLRFFLLFRPIHFFGGIGLALILSGGIYGLSKAFLIHKGFPVFGALLILLGVQSIFFGLICDQISSLRQERLD
ncbi:MAG: glycosyltransferase family 2 protein [Thermodesulfobacteriota bacterium]